MSELARQHAGELSVIELLAQVQRGEHAVVVEPGTAPDGRRVYILRPLAPSLARREQVASPHRYVPWWVWAAGLLILAAAVAAGGWGVYLAVIAVWAHAGQIVAVALIGLAILGGGGCCLAAAAKVHGH